MIYINGDSHSAGAELVKDYCFAQDDPRYLAWGRRAHPEAIPLTYGYKIAQALNQPFFMDAESASSNARILRTTKQFIEQTHNKTKLFCIIGWTTWEREEWLVEDQYLQVTASGTDSVPEHMVEEYKHWVSQQTQQEHNRKREATLLEIENLKNTLNEQGIRYLFFNTDEYIKYLTEQGYQTVNNGYHFGEDAHSAWYKHLLPQVKKLMGVQNTLTNTPKRSIINTVKEQFRGFN